MSTTYAPVLSIRSTRQRPVSRRPRRAVYLTRRGRTVVVLLLLALALAAFAVGRTGMSPANADVAPAAEPALGQTVVQSGETLWSVAQTLAPGKDTREVIRQIERLNGLTGDTVKAGQLLLLPTVEG